MHGKTHGGTRREKKPSPSPPVSLYLRSSASGRRGASTGQPVILLVEDEDFVREVTSQVLSSAGYFVLKARDAAEASRLFRRRRGHVQLVLTDMIMPGMSGAELARQLKVMRPAIKVVVMSGYPEIPIQEPDSGTYYLPKPFSVESLTSKVQQVLGEEGLVNERRKAAFVGGSR